MDGCFRTKAEPHIYYAPTRPLEEDTTEAEQRKEQVKCSFCECNVLTCMLYDIEM